MAQDALCRVMPSFRGRPDEVSVDRVLVRNGTGRLCFLSERYLLPEELRGGVDFLLAPFLSEPVGHTDVELGTNHWMCGWSFRSYSGVYFHQQNSLAPEMLKSGFFGALDFALNMPDEDYWNLAEAAHHARSFQAEQWRPDLSQVYDEVQRVFQGRRSDDQEPFDDRLWNNAASQEDLQSAIAPRRSSSLRPVSSTADLAHQMQVLDIDDDAEFLTQPVSESRAQEIMKAVAESLPYFSDHMDAGDLQRDISQARQRLQERNHMTRGLMKPFLRGLCLRIHLVMAICYVTSSVGELLLQTIEVEGEGRAPFGELWLAFYGGASLGGLFWLALSYGIPPNLLMTASQALSLMAFLLLPMLPEHLYEADWSYLSYAAMSGESDPKDSREVPKGKEALKDQKDPKMGRLHCFDLMRRRLRFAECQGHRNAVHMDQAVSSCACTVEVWQEVSLASTQRWPEVPKYIVQRQVLQKFGRALTSSINISTQPAGIGVAIWRLALLEALRRSVSWLALVATYATWPKTLGTSGAGKLWIYKQVPQRSNAPSGVRILLGGQIPTYTPDHPPPSTAFAQAVVVNPVPWLSCPQHGELVPEPSLPGAVPEGQLPAKLERSNTGISKASSLASSKRTRFLEEDAFPAPPPRLERSNTGMSKAPDGVGFFDLAALEWLASSNRTDSKKTRFLEEDPETISTETSAEATETSGRPSTARSELRQESSESETASHGSDVPAEDPGARTCRDSGREQ
ncbi:Hypothetical protein SCF082_LOCUS41868 [Durusdinium trenchii]|uniref:Uncharacterized protein n=1 Tax=Durusdinium trenchii TaxID=1381693 RepID=A0ABP0QKD7_9DINO